MDLANIIALVSQHNADPSTMSEIDDSPEVVEVLIGRNLPKPERAGKKQTQSPTEQVEASPDSSKGINPQAPRKPGPTTTALPDRGSLDGRSFLLTLRDAGKRSFQSINEVTGEVRTVVKVDQQEVRPDIIRAIHAFYYEVRHGVKVHVGYDPSQDFGAQEQAARALAQRELRGVSQGPTKEEQRAASRSLAGYVAGMPIPSQKLLANLQAREQAAVDAMLDAKTSEEKLTHGRVLASIRQAIAELV